jgi:hypothetical protein
MFSVNIKKVCVSINLSRLMGKIRVGKSFSELSAGG